MCFSGGVCKNVLTRPCILTPDWRHFLHATSINKTSLLCPSDSMRGSTAFRERRIGIHQVRNSGGPTAGCGCCGYPVVVVVVAVAVAVAVAAAAAVVVVVVAFEPSTEVDVFKRRLMTGNQRGV